MKNKPQGKILVTNVLTLFNALPAASKKEGERYLRKYKLTLAALKALQPPLKKPTPQPVPPKKPEEAPPITSYSTKMAAFTTLLYKIDFTKKSPRDKYTAKWVLDSYNDLRKLVPLPSVKSFEDVNVAQIEKMAYELWKAAEQRKWQLLGKRGSLPLEWIDLASQVDTFLARNVPVDRFNTTQSLFPYNFLRELLALPTRPSLETSDKGWFKTILPELELYSLVEQGKIKKASLAHKKLIEEVVQLLNMQRKIYSAQDPELFGGHTTMTSKGLTYVALCGTPDIDTRLFVLYHELGHIYHNDPVSVGLVNSKQINPQTFFNDPSFRADVEAIGRHLKQGIQLVPTLQNTEIGRLLARFLADPYVRSVFQKYGTFWSPPHGAEEYSKMVYLRGTEQRADLFAIRHLLQRNLISAILTALDTYGLQREKPYLISIGNLDPHPSGLERALYMLGFLAHQGIDVPAVLYKWETESICTYSEEEGTSAPSHVETIYEQWKAGRHKNT